jgi:hypothetical protein
VAAIADESGSELLDEGSAAVYDEAGSPAPDAAIPASASIIPAFLTMNL